MQAILSVISYLIATIKLDVFIPEIPPELLSLQYAVLKSSTLPKTISATPPSVAKALIAPVT